MKLSIVATLYQSAPYINEFHERATVTAKQLVGNDYEIVLVNDGSPDNSLDLAIRLTEQDSHVVVVDLSRNFGHHKAMMTGLAHAKGELVFLIDSDLEEEPEWLLSFDEEMKREQCDVVYGIQEKRKGGVFERVTGAAFYKLFRKLTGINQPDNIVTARLMTQRYVQALLPHRERELNIGGLWVITGFKQATHLVRKHSTSPTSYTLSGKFGHLVNAVTSFSSLPLVYTFYSGLFISISALIYIAYLFLRYFLIASPPSGYTSLIASIWFFSGLIIFFLGVQGIYLSKIFSEVKQRPYTIIRHIYQNEYQAYGEARLRSAKEFHTIRAPLTHGDPFFVRLATNQNLLKVLGKLILGKFILNQQNGVINPPGETYNQGAWHRDLPYQHFISNSPLAVNALFCVDDFTLENGSTFVLPATHKTANYPSDSYIRRNALQVEALAGQYILLDCMLFHSGGFNRTEKERRAVNHVYTIPYFKQQIKLPELLKDVHLTSDQQELFGFKFEEPCSIDQYLANRTQKP